jgi:hypothetical protein
MRLKMKKHILNKLLSLLLILALTACGQGQSAIPLPSEAPEAPSAEMPPVIKEPPVAKSPIAINELTIFNGKWEGVFHLPERKHWNWQEGEDLMPEFAEDWTLDIHAELGEVTNSTYNVEFWPMLWQIVGERLNLVINDAYNEIRFDLALINDTTLAGTVTQFGISADSIFTKISETPDYGEFMIYVRTDTERELIKQLIEYSEYSDEKAEIPFTYELNNREGYEEFIEEYGLDKVAEGLSDVDLMIALLDWAGENFRHNGSSGMPAISECNAISIANFHSENPSGINCRLLAILLAEMCRVYGIEAKHITLYGKDQGGDVHVVVHAYSRELKQWVMLDPTFKLYLKNTNGDYISLPMLRESFAKGERLISNDKASHNDNGFGGYEEFMENHIFSFSNATDFYFGAEEYHNSNVVNMLVPVGYADRAAERTITSAESFWAAP